MARITLIFTVHSAMGLCNEIELLKILESIGPDVLFEEIRQSDFDSFYRFRAKSTLETRTVGRYLKSRAVRQVPVDEFTIPLGFHGDAEFLFDYVESNNSEYCELIVERNDKVSALGFMYLNSQKFKALSNRSQESFQRTVALSGSQALIDKLSAWDEKMRFREASMLDNIYKFSRSSSFTDGCFLVGAEHMSGILESIDQRVQVESGLIEWHVWNEP